MKYIFFYFQSLEACLKIEIDKSISTISCQIKSSYLKRISLVYSIIYLFPLFENKILNYVTIAFFPIFFSTSFIIRRGKFPPLKTRNKTKFSFFFFSSFYSIFSKKENFLPFLFILPLFQKRKNFPKKKLEKNYAKIETKWKKKKLRGKN